MKITMGNIIGKVTKTTIIGAGYLTQGVGIISDKIVKDEKIKNNIHEKTEKISKTIKDSAAPISDKVSEGVTKAILMSEKVGGNITKTVAEKMNASPETIAAAEKCGEFAGKAIASGVTAGACIAAAGTSAATVGASVFTHGIATLGLGSMYGGLVTVSAIAGSVFATEKNNKDEEKAKKDKLDETKKIEDKNENQPKE